MVAGAEPVAVGVRLQPGPGRHRLSAGLPGDAAGLCEREFPVRRHVVCEAVAARAGRGRGIIMPSETGAEGL